MEPLTARLARVARELTQIQEVLGTAAHDSEQPPVSLAEISEFKDRLDYMRRFVWLYINVFSRRSQDFRPVETGVAPAVAAPDTADMRTLFPHETVSAGEAPLGFFEEVQSLVTGLFEKHFHSGTTTEPGPAIVPGQD